MLRGRPMDSIQGFMSSFKQFEKKLDKLQDDVNYHGNTLSELRMMVANLAVAINADTKIDELKRPKKNTAIQYEGRLHVEEPKLRRKNAIQAMPTKLKAKSFQDQKYGLRPESPYHLNKMSSPLIAKVKAKKAEVKKGALKVNEKKRKARK